MSEQQARYQSLAACGAAVIAVIGVAHEYIGAMIFPWAPVLLGPIGWHGLGLLAIIGGALSLAGTLHLIRFPVTLLSLTTVVLATVVGVFTWVVHQEFHLFAFVAAGAGATTAYFHRATRDHRPLVGRSKRRSEAETLRVGDRIRD